MHIYIPTWDAKFEVAYNLICVILCLTRFDHKELWVEIYLICSCWLMNVHKLHHALLERWLSNYLPHKLRVLIPAEVIHKNYKLNHNTTKRFLQTNLGVILSGIYLWICFLHVWKTYPIFAYFSVIFSSQICTLC